jgi:catechol 2,3-dioxygenase-like lactoylglutathione lyase family enzyme
VTLAISHLDHPVIAVRDMDASHGVYEKLGFTIPPRGSHLEWGTGNWCIMFPDDYLELRGIVDDSRYTHNLDRYLEEKGEGLMGLAFAPAISAQASYERAQEAGLEPTGLKSLTRRFERPEGDAFPRFSIAYLNEATIPEFLTSVVCEHLTPEVIRAPEWLRHPNGVTGIIALTGVTNGQEQLRPRLAAVFGEDAVTVWPDRLSVTLPRGARIDYLTPQAAAGEGLALTSVSAPYLSALTLAVASIAATRAVLDGNGVAYEETGSGIVARPPVTGGLHIQFVQS